MDLEKIANLIKTKRKEKNLTQEELAKKLNVTEKAISRWETGRGTPDISLLLPLSKELGVSVSEILSGKEDKKSNENIKEIIEYMDIRKKKNNKKFLNISIIIYGTTLFFYLLYLKFEYNPVFVYSIKEEIIINTIFILLTVLASKIMTNYYDKVEEKEKIEKSSYIAIFIIYIIMIVNLTMLGRFQNVIGYNLIPFKTIWEYVIHFHQFNLDILLVNILGNIVVFMPVQYLILKIWRIKKFTVILGVDLLLLLTIEISQFITHTGILDVDDIILNLFGMLILYFGMQRLEKKKNKEKSNTNKKI